VGEKKINVGTALGFSDRTKGVKIKGGQDKDLGRQSEEARIGQEHAQTR